VRPAESEAGLDLRQTSTRLQASAYGIGQKEGLRLSCSGQGKQRGNFFDREQTATGCLAVNRQVSETVAGPWFKWQTNDDELLSVAGGEDVFFFKALP